MFDTKDLTATLRVAVSALLEQNHAPEEIIELTQAILETQKRKRGIQDQPQQHTYHDENGVQIRLDVYFNPIKQRVFYKDKRILLSPTESKLLFKFLDNYGEVLSHKDLVLDVSGEPSNGDYSEAIRTWLHRLRSKLEIIPGSENWIKTVRGKGYYFSVD
jgi:DNA-binding response OmpR family regulator